MPSSNDASTLATEWTPLLRLRNPNDGEAWERFWTRYQCHLMKVARQFGCPRSDIDDLTQEVLLGVVARTGDLERRASRGAFRGWIDRLIRWRISDRLRARRRTEERLVPGPHAQARLEQVPAPEWKQAVEREILTTALCQLQPRFSARTIQIYGLYVLDDLDVAVVADFCCVSRAQVYLAKHRVTPVLRRRILALQRLEAMKASVHGLPLVG